MFRVFTSDDGKHYKGSFGDTKCTVEQFMAGIFEHKPDTYGYIGIKDNNGVYGELNYSYRFGELKTAPTEDISNKNIKDAEWQRCHGRRVDYLLTI